MKLRCLALLVCIPAAILVMPLQSNAQTDSVYHDLGRIKLQKNFTQGVTVKGEDLQRFPFTNLSEAINVWFNGAYSTKLTLTYVVDGNLATDVNQYPIYDIEEITLVQNALAYINGSSQQQQLVVITTKRNRKSRSGIQANAQASWIQRQSLNSTASPFDKGTGIYHQYDVSGFKNFNQTYIGASVNYLHDELPTDNNVQTISPAQLNRVRLNAYINTLLWKGSTLDLNAGYVPQRNKENFAISNDYAQSNYGVKNNEHLLNGAITLNSKMAAGFQNQIKAVYNTFDANYNAFIHQVISIPSINSTYSVDNDRTNHILNLTDELRYTKQAGSWLIEPALSLNYRYTKNKAELYNVVKDASANINSINSATSTLVSKNLILTPNINLSYKDIINVNGGASYLLHDNAKNDYGSYDYSDKKLFPFISGTLNAGRLISSANKLNWNIYSSYTVTNTFNDYNVNLTDFAAYLSPYQFSGSTFSASPVTLYWDDYNKTFKTFSAGTSADIVPHLLSLSYNFALHNSAASVSYILPSPFNQQQSISLTADSKIYSHRIAANLNLVNRNQFSWRANINATTIKQRLRSDAYTFINSIAIGENDWTGGWANRLQYRSFVGGLDVLYLFGKNKLFTPTPQDLKSISLQNVYAGWQLKTSQLKTLEFYVSGRNLTQNKSTVLTEYRRYMGLGIKAAL